jgi:hypothetical protein
VVLADHKARCPKSRSFYAAHGAVVQAVNMTSDEMHFGRARVNEMRALRPDNTRQGDIVIQQYEGLTHLVIDVTVGSPLAGCHLDLAAANPGHVANKLETLKFAADSNSSLCLGMAHRFVPFAVEEFGRLGDHAQALLYEWACRLVATHRPELLGSPAGKLAVQHQLRIWRQRLSLAVNVTHAQSALNADSNNTRTLLSGVLHLGAWP